VQLGLGLGIFLVLGSIYNYLRFDTPLHASYYHWLSYHRDGIPADLFPNGLFDISYIQRHIPVVFKELPIFMSDKPYLLIPQGGMAIWATSPALIYAFFAGIRGKRSVALGLALLFLGILVAVVFARGMPEAIHRLSQDFPEGLHFPYRLELAPFILLIALGVLTGLRNRNKMVLACWAAIIPTALTHFIVGVTGWPQFGYRFALDYYPFLFLLAITAIGDELKWYHKLLIILSVAANLVGVLWMYEFGPDRALGVDWVAW